MALNNNRKTLYWIAQCSGWLFYFFFVLIYNLFGNELTYEAVVSSFLIVLVGIGVTHLYRFLIIRLNWLRYPLIQAIPRILFSGFVLGAVFLAVHDLLTQLILQDVQSFFSNDLAGILQMVLNWTFLIVFWAILYFTAHYFFNYKRQEIANLKLEASRNEIELNNLKSQLNPHFMFNALNGIRALIDENPVKAKESITQLSVLLRAALNTGKQRTIKFVEELQLVETYLALEKMRFEDRLTINLAVNKEVHDLPFPPLMLQTVVENGVKHGISKLPGGGAIKIEGYIKDGQYVITVSNTGSLEEKGVSLSQGVGLKNTQRRLRLIYGKNASLTIANQGDTVITEIFIPKN